MSREENESRRSALLGVRFLGPAVLGSALMILTAAFGTTVQLTVLGCFVSILCGLFLSYCGRADERKKRSSASDAVENLAAPPALTSDPDLFRLFQTLRDSLTDMAQKPDETLRAAALAKLSSLSDQIESMRAGTIVFAGTEPWRAIYDALLANPRLKEYWAVAWVRSSDYWQDALGQQSMRANFDAVYRGVLTERFIILPESLWPAGSLFPTEAIRPWIEEQHNNGLRVFLVRERDLAADTDLPADFGLYDERLVATQEIDEHSRTVRFTLDINPDAIRLALDCWRRLSVHGISYRVILDRSERAG